MGKKIKVILEQGHRIKKTGIFDFHKLYEEMHDWILTQQYFFNEKDYTTKDTDLGKEMKIVWEGEKIPTPYIKYYFKIAFQLKRLVQASEKLVKGNIQITFLANIEVDYKNKWRDTKLSNFLFNIYTNYLIKNEIKQYSQKLYNEMIELQTLAKEVLDFYK